MIKMGIFSFFFAKKKESHKDSTQNKMRDDNNHLNNDDFSSAQKDSAILSKIDLLVKRSVQLEPKGDIDELQNCLYQLYSLINKPGCSQYIIQYGDKLNLALCFVFMLKYDWVNDPDIREVWAEDGFYCIQEYLDNQPYGRQGQAEGMIIYFTLLSVGRNSLKPKIQDILDKAKQVGNNVFHQDDYSLGAQHVIDQFALLSVSGIRVLGQKAVPIMSRICQRYNGTEFFQKTISRTDLMKYDPMDIIQKSRFVRNVIGTILNEA